MAHSHFEILSIELNEHLRRVYESRYDLQETITMTRKSIAESRALMAEADAIIAWR
jgi:hypothetical protein